MVEAVSSDQMDAFIPTIELAYREILLIKHTEGLNVNEKSTKQYIRMALNVLRETMDTARRVLSTGKKRVEPLGGRDFLYLETISNISWKTVFTVPQIAEMIDRFPSLERCTSRPSRTPG